MSHPADSLTPPANASIAWIAPDWPAPDGIRALTTTRQGGFSLPPWHGLNLADHVGDDPAHVAANRQLLKRSLDLPREPAWLTQEHGTRVIELPHDAPPHAPPPLADASFTRQPGHICAVLTADCLPVLFCHPRSGAVAAVHAGWRGLQAGILDTTLAALDVPPRELLVWLGPGIGRQSYEVGETLRESFLASGRATPECFTPGRPGHWFADLCAIARRQLVRQGVAGNAIHGGRFDTFTDPRLYSHRRHAPAGRMATLVWIAQATR